MENNTANNNGKTGFFSLLYRTRLVITKGDTTILNLSVLFSVISLLCAPWLVVIGAIVALAGAIMMPVVFLRHREPVSSAPPSAFSPRV